ncbi:unnamed protein product [Parnassius apollo]|uniref:(apollo) hypothetical protein n=1 Tax=Parnassius apollo TaxID=110799 RepID=A0A8S3W9J0_PARAO|nr:unnamed protein product [Parnassius apollo]
MALWACRKTSSQQQLRSELIFAVNSTFSERKVGARERDDDGPSDRPRAAAVAARSSHLETGPAHPKYRHRITYSRRQCDTAYGAVGETSRDRFLNMSVKLGKFPRGSGVRRVGGGRGRFRRGPGGRRPRERRAAAADPRAPAARLFTRSFPHRRCRRAQPRGPPPVAARR